MQVDNKPAEPSMWQRLVSLQAMHANRTRVLVRTLELLLFSLLLPVCGLFLFPENPTGIATGFPWVAVAPLVFSARYGCGWGVASAVVLAVFINLPLIQYSEYAAAHRILGIGTIAICLIVGDITSAMIKRHAQAEAECRYLRRRFHAFSTDYHVLKVSHEELEKYMAGTRPSLRQALQSLHSAGNGCGNLSEMGNEIMVVLSRFCAIQVAGLYSVTESGVVGPEPIAAIGCMPKVSAFDRVLRLALSERELVSIRHESLTGDQQASAVIAAVPLIDIDGVLHGVLAIKDMQFIAFQQDNLNALAILGRYVGNLLCQSHAADNSRLDHFLTELKLSLLFARKHEMKSVLLSLQYEPSDQGLQVAEFVCDSVRSIDSSWLSTDGHESPVVCLLFPLMSVSDAQAYLARLNRAVSAEFGIQLSHIMQDSQLRALSARDSLDSCKTFFTMHMGEYALQESNTPAKIDNAA